MFFEYRARAEVISELNILLRLVIQKPAPVPYIYDRGNGTSGKVVLHTIANNGGCSDWWGKLWEISTNNDVIDKALKRALKEKFQRDIPDPLETRYKYWKEGFW